MRQGDESVSQLKQNLVQDLHDRVIEYERVKQLVSTLSTTAGPKALPLLGNAALDMLHSLNTVRRLPGSDQLITNAEVVQVLEDRAASARKPAKSVSEFELRVSIRAYTSLLQHVLSASHCNSREVFAFRSTPSFEFRVSSDKLIAIIIVVGAEILEGDLRLPGKAGTGRTQICDRGERHFQLAQRQLVCLRIPQYNDLPVADILDSMHWAEVEIEVDGAATALQPEARATSGAPSGESLLLIVNQKRGSC